VTQKLNTKPNVSLATVTKTAKQELWEDVFSLCPHRDVMQQWMNCWRRCSLVVRAEAIYVEQKQAESNKQKSYKIMKMQMFATSDKANRDTGSIIGLNLAAVNHTTVQVT
jgi:hypothetical protein